MRRDPRRAATNLLALTLVALTAGCGGAAPPTEPAPLQRVENASLGLALASIPEGFRLEANSEGEEPRIVLVRKPELPPGTAVVEVGPEQIAGVNLVAAVNEQKAYIESLPEGNFQGQTELMGPTGTAYLTRGRYRDEAGAEVEQMRAFTLHPAANRRIVVTYTYTLSGDTKDRGQQMMELLGEIEPPAAAPETGEAPESEASEDAS